jgi:DNA-binding MarR family transcriptional regulator
MEVHNEPPSRAEEILRSWKAIQPDLDFSILQITLRLLMLGKQVIRKNEDDAARLGLNGGDYRALLALARTDGPMRPTDLFRELLVTSGGITKQLDRLEGYGLIKRVHSASDRRGVLVTLTKQGRKVALSAIKISSEGGSFRDALETLSKSDRATLQRLLNQLLNALSPSSSARPDSDVEPPKARRSRGTKGMRPD